MQLTQTLEELLQMFGAHIIHFNTVEYCVTVNKSLPPEVAKLALNVNMSVPMQAVDILGKTQVAEQMFGTATYDYTFAADSKEAVRALLFLATEKERYDKFCKSIDSEITEELGTPDTQV